MLIGFYDIETTGLLSPEHRLIEVYLAVYNLEAKSLIREFEKRINPERSIAVDAQRVHGISNAMLAGCPTWDFVAPDLLAALHGVDLIVAHNGDGFDKPFTEQELKRVGLKMPQIQWLDTMTSGRWSTPNGKVPNLGELAFACAVPYDPALAHAASYDVKIMAECFFKGLEWGFFTLPEGIK